MGQRRTSEPQKSFTYFSQLLLVPILFFIAIGNGIRTFASLTFLMLHTIFSTIRRYVPQLRAFTSYVRLPRVRLPRFPDIRFSLPSLQILRMSLPRVTAKKTALPQKQSGSIPEKRPALIQIRSFLAGSAITVLVFFIPYSGWQFVQALPSPQLLSQREIPVSTKIFDRNGAILYEMYTEQNRTPVALSDIPEHVKHATIAIEDRSFYHHPGFSVRGMVRAAREITVNNRVQGGSTITQQLIKSALLTPEITVIRKVKELILAFWAEQIYSKDQILEMYLNQVPYGGTAWGIQAAAQTYFAKNVADLTLAEAALLTGLPAAPTEYSPFGSHPEKAIIRQKEVLRSMTEIGAITDTDMQQALAEPVRYATPQIPIRAPHFVMYVKALLENKYGTRLIEQGGLRVVTSLDLNLQETAQDIVRKHIDNLSAYHVTNGAALVTSPSDGQILAMVGSRDYFDTANDGNVNIALSHRQPGSSIKVVTYAAALERGMTAATLLQDSPVTYRSPGSPDYSPVNYDSRYHGHVPLRYALANSYNIPAVRTLEAIGIPEMTDKAKRMGIDSWSTNPGAYGMALTLGSAEVTMLDMAEVYGTLANLGRRVDLNPILEISDYEGNIIYRAPQPTGIAAVSPDAAWILTDILSDNIARASAFGQNSGLVIPGKTVAVKTGTTNDKRDNWADGYTPSHTVIVWVGNNDNSPMNQAIASGITGATPIWHDIMEELLKNRIDEVHPRPQTVVPVPCYFGRTEYFIKSTEPANGQCRPIPTPSLTPASQ